MNSNYETIKNFLCSSTLPEYTVFFALLNKTSEILDGEYKFYRDCSDDEIPGSLLDFQGQDLPTIVVPDLHARPLFLLNILNYKLPFDFLLKTERKFWNGDLLSTENSSDGFTVFEALERKLVRIICVGDALHTEKSTRWRWEEAYIAFQENDFVSDPMKKEMTEGLALLCGLMKLKELFPENFHFLKGNHENIANVTDGGNFAFVKYVDEGQMVKEFIKEYYGEDILYLMAYVEQALPLIAVTSNIVISHAEPRCGFSRDQLVNAHFNGNTIQALTWTDNNEAEDGSVMQIIENLTQNSENAFEVYRYIGGHRPVKENYALRQNGLYVQIHNPLLQNIALVYCNKRFSPETDLVAVDAHIENKNGEE